MEDEPLAYHLVARAMEDRAGLSAGQRFALALRHAVDGHLPHDRYRQAAIDRRAAGAGAESVERSVARWMAVDLNPLVRSLSSLRSVSNAIWGYNAYNSEARLGVRTRVESVGAAARVARRESRVAKSDPELCVVGTVSALDRVLSAAARNRSRGAGSPPGVLEVGRLLGVEASAAFQLAEALAAGEASNLAEAARSLGASRRSLQRRLAEESTSFEAVRAAARMVAATDMLRSEATLAEVAWSCGFSDLPHMTRAMKAACGMAPGMVRAILQGGADPLAELRLSAPEFPERPWRVDSTDIGASQGTMPPGLANARASNRRDEE